MHTFSKDRWLGNKWPSIEITPVEGRCFLRLLDHLVSSYAAERPKVIDTMEGCVADLQILGCPATMHLDCWSFSIAFKHESVRDSVFSELETLPADFFAQK